MKIGISALFMRQTPAGGANSLVINLLNGMLETSAPPSTIRMFTNTDIFDDREVPVESMHPPKWTTNNRFIQDVVYTSRNSQDLDGVLFGNYFVPPFMPRIQQIPIIHDLLQVHHPEYFSRKKLEFQRVTQAFAIRSATAVVTISEFCREDIVRIYGQQAATKVNVIPNPIDWSRFSTGTPDSRILNQIGAAPYLLSVTAQYPHKNLETLVRAFAEVVRRRPEVRLVLAGQLAANLIGNSTQMDIQGLIRDLGLKNQVVVTGFVDDATLGALYRNCTIFALPSLFEGFGMPAVEALGLGKPVIASDGSAIPEATMGLAHYISDPLNIGDWVEHLISVIDTPKSYQPDSNSVQKIREAYFPDKIAQQYLDLFR